MNGSAGTRAPRFEVPLRRNALVVEQKDGEVARHGYKEHDERKGDTGGPDRRCSRLPVRVRVREPRLHGLDGHRADARRRWEGEHAGTWQRFNAAFRYELAKLMVGELAVVTTGPGVSIEVQGEEEDLDDAEAKAVAGLAVELDPGNDRYREFYDRFR